MPLHPETARATLAGHEGEEVCLTLTPERRGELSQIVGKFIRFHPPSAEVAEALARRGFVADASDDRAEVWRPMTAWRVSDEHRKATGRGVPYDEIEAAKLDGRWVPDPGGSPFKKPMIIPLSDIEEIQFPTGTPG